MLTRARVICMYIRGERARTRAVTRSWRIGPLAELLFASFRY